MPVYPPAGTETRYTMRIYKPQRNVDPDMPTKPQHKGGGYSKEATSGAMRRRAKTHRRRTSRGSTRI